MARSCVFCGKEGKLTAEHIFPRWIGRYLPLADRVTDVTHVHKIEGEVNRAWTAGEVDLRVRLVCATCNNGWMHDLERASRPLLVPLMRGVPKTHTPAEQRILATWAIKTALMCDLYNRETRAAPDEHFRFLYEHRRPLPNSQVWLGRYVGERELDYNHRQLHLTSPDGTVGDGYLVALIVNRLVMYVLAFAGDTRYRTELSGPHRFSTQRIQPVHQLAIRWPPETPMGDEDIERFLLGIAPERAAKPPPLR